MNARERWLAALRGQTPDFPPCDYWGTPEVTSRLRRDLGCQSDRELWNTLGVDKCAYLAAHHPRAAEDTWHTPSLFSVWGIPVSRISYLDGEGSYEESVNPPLRAAQTPVDIERHPWPNPDDWDYASLHQQCLEWAGHPIVGASFEPFYLYCRLRGMEQSLTDLMENPVMADALMERIYEIHADIVEKSLAGARGLIDFVYVAEDLGTQSSLLMSPRLFRRFIKPWLAKMIALAHRHGAYVFHHNDGAIAPLIPDLLEIGIDVLNPIQWRCKGMDRDSLAQQFGQSIVFHGGIDNQQTLPFGTADDVRQEVHNNLKIFGKGKGYIVSPCHNLQANTPTANIVALYEAIKN